MEEMIATEFTQYAGEEYRVAMTWAAACGAAIKLIKAYRA
jgi:roadblock/LC7 domain-containing protein